MVKTYFFILNFNEKNGSMLMCVVGVEPTVNQL